MLNIVIKDENKNRIDNAINAAQTRARTRYVDYDDVVTAVKYAEKKFGVARKNLTGVEVVCDPHAWTYPNAYKGTPEATHFVIKCTGRGWNLIEVYRGNCNHAHRYTTRILPDTAKSAIIEQFKQFV